LEAVPKAVEGEMRFLTHYLNSMHIYCRLRSIGIGRDLGLYIVKRYERLIHPVLYRK
jgi:hypothetical protein